MGKNTKIFIQSILINESDQDVIKTVADCKCFFRGKKTYIIYNEPQEAGFSDVKTIVKIDDQKVFLTRIGDVEQKTLFEAGKIDLCNYKTPYMNIDMIVDTKNLMVVTRENFIDIYIEYELVLGHQSQGLIKLRMLAGEDNGFEN